jgi:hypothetical protein
MAAVKRLNTTYTLDTTDVYLTGNLHVLGVYDTTNVTNTNVEDKDIALNVGEAGWGVGGNVAPGQSGIIVDRGLQANVALRWNEIYDNWEVTTDGTTYANIATSASSGITAVVEDTSPTLGGNLETNGYQINFQTPTTLLFGNTLVYADTVGSAGSGLFVVNSGTASDELVTKSKAIVFSIIL